jgi:integrase
MVNTALLQSRSKTEATPEKWYRPTAWMRTRPAGGGRPKAHGISFTSLQKPRNVTQEFGRKATALGFSGPRFHDLRRSHETVLLDKGVPVHIVVARCSHNPAVLLRSYPKGTKADTSAAEVISKLSKGALT